MQTVNPLKDIIKLEPRIVTDRLGKRITIYRQKIFKPDHPDYPEELKKMQDHIDAQRSKPLTLIPKGA